MRQGAAGIIGEFGKERLRLGLGERAHGGELEVGRCWGKIASFTLPI